MRNEPEVWTAGGGRREDATQSRGRRAHSAPAVQRCGRVRAGVGERRRHHLSFPPVHVGTLPPPLSSLLFALTSAPPCRRAHAQMTLGRPEATADGFHYSDFASASASRCPTSFTDIH